MLFRENGVRAKTPEDLALLVLGQPEASLLSSWRRIAGSRVRGASLHRTCVSSPMRDGGLGVELWAMFSVRARSMFLRPVKLRGSGSAPEGVDEEVTWLVLRLSSRRP